MPPTRDDQSGYLHRQLIGYIGLALPVALVMIAGFRSPDGPGQWQILGSISAYYYTGAVTAFVGLLVALALFLFTYRGYGNRFHWADRAAAIIGGTAALGVAFFPTGPMPRSAAPAWWRESTGWLHYGSAAVLFTVFAIFSLWLFRLGAPDERPTEDKKLRNHVHLLCGLTIAAAILWVAVNAITRRPIFVPESVALAAFAVSWLVKGYAHRSIIETARSVAQKTQAVIQSAPSAVE